MNDYIKEIVGLLCLVIFGTVFLMLPTEGLTDEYYVKTTGTRSSGPSDAGDWSDSNCYQSISEAAGRATNIVDSIYLYNETHFASGQIILSCDGVFNQYGDTDFGAATVSLDTAVDSCFMNNALRGNDLTVTGITFEGQTRSLPVFYLENNSGLTPRISISSCRFDNNTGNEFGGALECRGGNSFELCIDGCFFENNAAVERGGAIYLNGTLTANIESTFFGNNWVSGLDSRGGAVYFASSVSGGKLDVSDCEFKYNEAVRMGSAILSVDVNETHINDCIIEENITNRGLLIQFSNAAVNIRRTNLIGMDCYSYIKSCYFNKNISFSNDSVGSDGGGIITRGGGQDDLMISVVEDSEFRNNYAKQGGGYYVGRYCESFIRRCRFINNSSGYSGGAIAKGGKFPGNSGERAEISYCEFIGNSAGYKSDGSKSALFASAIGGAALIRFYPMGLFYNCSFLNNRASAGDALWQEGSGFSQNNKCELINCIFYGENGLDVQIWSREGGFEKVDYCAFASGEYVCTGVDAENAVQLIKNPCISLEDAHLADGSPCIMPAAIVPGIHDIVGGAFDLDNNTVLDHPDIGAYQVRDIDNNNAGSGGGGGGGCFIATAACGSPFAYEVEILCKFRDKILKTKPYGRSLIEFYYNHSPPIAAFIEKNKVLKVFARMMLLPIVGICWAQLHFEVSCCILIVFILYLIALNKNENQSSKNRRHLL